MADEPELQKGQSSEWAQYLQQLLAAAGYWQGSVDGEFGDELEAAVIQFQQASGLTADGVVRQETWDALTGGGGQSGGDEPTGEQTIDLDPSDFPALAYLLQFGDTEDGTDQYLAALGVNVGELTDDDTAIA